MSENDSIFKGLALGPMAGVTDLPFRLLCRRYGCNLTYTEMVSAKAVLYNNKNTTVLLKRDNKDSPVGIQLFGSEPDIMAEIAKRLEPDWDFIDINMGCPVPKIVNNNEGSALMKQPKLVEQIISKMAKQLSKPLTVKIRKGFNDASVNAVEIARIAEASGASAIAVHGRTREQYYYGEADWSIIAQVKNAIKIPVIGNGDVKCFKDYVKIKEQTGCDAVMVGRAALGNPFIFKQINEGLDEAVSDQELYDVIIEHMQGLMDIKGEYTAVREMRKHVAWYYKNRPNATQLRRSVNEAETFSDMKTLLERYILR